MKQILFVTTPIKRTLAVCGAHDGKIYDFADSKQGSTVPLLHSHCPDYNIAIAWQCLIDGDFEERDIILLRHEHLESSLGKRYNLKYSDAHELANKSIIEELFGGRLEDASIGKTDKDKTE